MSSSILNALTKENDNLIDPQADHATQQIDERLHQRAAQEPSVWPEAAFLLDTPDPEETPAPPPPSKLAFFNTTGSIVTLAMATMIGLSIGFFPPHMGLVKAGIRPAAPAEDIEVALTEETQSAPEAAQEPLETLEAPQASHDAAQAAMPAQEPGSDLQAQVEDAAPVSEPELVQAPQPQEVILPAPIPSSSPLLAQQVQAPARMVVQVQLRPAGQTETTLQEDMQTIYESAPDMAMPVPVSEADIPLAAPGLSDPSMPEVLYESASIPAMEEGESESVKSSSSSSSKSSASSTPVRKKSSDLVLEGIFYDSTRPMALINGEIVEVGSRVGKARVLEIQRDSVRIEQSGTQRTLRP